MRSRHNDGGGLSRDHVVQTNDRVGDDNNNTGYIIFFRTHRPTLRLPFPFCSRLLCARLLHAVVVPRVDNPRSVHLTKARARASLCLCVCVCVCASEWWTRKSMSHFSIRHGAARRRRNNKARVVSPPPSSARYAKYYATRTYNVVPATHLAR